MKEEKYSGFTFVFIVALLVIGSCTTREEERLSDKLPDNLKVISVYGERKFLKDKLAVEFSGWESESPQTLFLTDGHKTYLLSYVIPRRLIYDVWENTPSVVQKLEYFSPSNDGLVRIDERTTALNLVVLSPPYFWLFTPRAIVYAAGYIVNHKDFDLLAEKIREAEPGSLMSGKHPEIFSLAQSIAEDVRKVITPTNMFSPSSRISEKQEGCGDERIAKLEDDEGTKIKLVVRHMVFYGGAVFNGIDPTRINDIREYFLLKAQEAKIDLSLDNIIQLNFINPRVETKIDLRDYNRHAIRLEKGFELSLSVLTDPVKRVGLVANFGRIVKYAIEIAVPNIAVCIPDGDTWGYLAVTVQNLFTSEDINDIRGVLSSSWDEIVRLLVSSFADQNSWVYRILNKVGFASCSYSPNFIISQIAGLIRNFPIVKLYDAFTRYIPFGYELFTKPKTAIYGAQNGAPITGEQIIVSVDPATQVNSPGMLKIETIGPECRGNCYIRLMCPIFGVHELRTYLNCGLSTVNLEVPNNFYGDECKLILAVRHGTVEVTTSQYTLKIKNCPQCAYNPSGSGEPPEEGGGCTSSGPYNVYTLAAIAIILGMLAVRRKSIICS